MTLKSYDAPSWIATKVAKAIEDIGEDGLWPSLQTEQTEFPSSQTQRSFGRASQRTRSNDLDRTLVNDEPVGGRAPEPDVRPAISVIDQSRPSSDSDRRRMKLSPPLLIRALSNRALFSPGVFSHANVIGWRYFLAEPPTMVDFHIRLGKAGNITCGAIVEHLGSAAMLAERNFASKPVVYYAGILEVPVLQVSALTIEGNGELALIVFRDPGPDTSLRIESPHSFGRRLASLIKTRPRYNPYDEASNEAIPDSAVEYDTSYLDNISVASFPPYEEAGDPTPRIVGTKPSFG